MAKAFELSLSDLLEGFDLNPEGSLNFDFLAMETVSIVVPGVKLFKKANRNPIEPSELF